MASLSFDDDSGFARIAEPFGVQALIAQATVEAFTQSILPRAARLNVERADLFVRPVKDVRDGTLGQVVYIVQVIQSFTGVALACSQKDLNPRALVLTVHPCVAVTQAT